MSDLVVSGVPGIANFSLGEPESSSKYIWITICKTLKTIFPNLLALLKAICHNLFSLTSENGKWYASKSGATFELKGSKDVTEAVSSVSLVRLKKNTKTTEIGELAACVTTVVADHFTSKGIVNPSEVVLLGQSMGGVIALRAAAKLKERFPGMNVRVVTVFSPNQGTNLLMHQKYNEKSMLHKNFHPESPFVSAAYVALACTRFIAANDHIIPKTAVEISACKEAGCIITQDGHNTYAANPSTVRQIKAAVLPVSSSVDQKTHVFCIHGLGGFPGNLYELGKEIAG